VFAAITIELRGFFCVPEAIKTVAEDLLRIPSDLVLPHQLSFIRRIGHPTATRDTTSFGIAEA
jgi:hypothetical protein